MEARRGGPWGYRNRGTTARSRKSSISTIVDTVYRTRPIALFVSASIRELVSADGRSPPETLPLSFFAPGRCLALVQLNNAIKTMDSLEKNIDWYNTATKTSRDERWRSPRKVFVRMLHQARRASRDSMRFNGVLKMYYRDAPVPPQSRYLGTNSSALGVPGSTRPGRAFRNRSVPHCVFPEARVSSYDVC